MYDIIELVRKQLLAKQFKATHFDFTTITRDEPNHDNKISRIEVYSVKVKLNLWCHFNKLPNMI